MTDPNDEITDIDLYGDLHVDVNKQLSYDEMKERCDKYEHDLQDLKNENTSLKEQNEILRKNISSLFLTARNEITRKDLEIKRLQELEVKNRKYRENKREAR